MPIRRPLTVIGLVAVLVGCDFASRNRYEIVPAGGEMPHLVYRLDQETGEVCLFRWWHQAYQEEGFNLVGCQGSHVAPLSGDTPD